MHHYEQYLGYDGFSRLTVADLKHGDKILSMLATKLQALPTSQLQSRILEEKVGFLMQLLRETFANRYQALSLSAFAQILVALDYFLKVKDGKPDTLSNGYADDLAEINKIFEVHSQELSAFKAWQSRQPGH